MNVRAQISMDAELRHRAQARAAELGITFAEYVRRLVARDLVQRRSKVHISALFDLVTDGPPTDIARDKDKMVGEALWHSYLRRRRLA